MVMTAIIVILTISIRIKNSHNNTNNKKGEIRI